MDGVYMSVVEEFKVSNLALISNETIAAGANKVYTVEPATVYGYTPIGAVGFYAQGTNSQYIMFSRVNLLSSGLMNVQCRNAGTSAATAININVKVLYMKTH